MSPSVFSGASGAPIDLDVHRRIRLRRLGLQGPVARAVADLAFGIPERDEVSALQLASTARVSEAVRVR